ncbi:MAG: hydroxymethylglutaryl-CoA synthase, partial [Syntrophales bacterium]|nr:hydroxymethylglutaryl-CoA synthase [Syntrophales bacterium]
MTVGIVGYGVCVPRHRILVNDIAKAWGSRGKGEKSVTGPDEDCITMAVEASINAVRSSGIPPEKIGAVYFGAVSSPYIENYGSGIIKEVFGMSPEVEVSEFTGSPRASLSALKSAVDNINAGRLENILVVAADDRPSEAGSDLETMFGAGAAAFVIGKTDIIAEIGEIFTYSTMFIDRWRHVGDDHVRSYDYRYTREYGYINHVRRAVEGLLKKQGEVIDGFHHVVLQEPDGRASREVSKALGIRKEQTSSSLVDLIGDTGNSSVFLGLAGVFENAKAGEKVLAVSYGAGASDALALTITDRVKKTSDNPPSLKSYLAKKEYIDYQRYLRYRGVIQQAGEPAKLALPPVSPFVQRSYRELYLFVGAKCRGCGYINFPPSLRVLCIKCGGADLEQVKLSKKGTIHTYCINYYMPPPLEAP